MKTLVINSTSKCEQCPVKHLCISREKGGLDIDRSKFAEAVEINKINYQNNKDLY